MSRAKTLDRIGTRPVGQSKDTVCHSMVTGMDYLRNPRLFKGMGFTLEERQALGKFTTIYFNLSTLVFVHTFFLKSLKLHLFFLILLSKCQCLLFFLERKESWQLHVADREQLTCTFKKYRFALLSTLHRWQRPHSYTFWHFRLTNLVRIPLNHSE